MQRNQQCVKHNFMLGRFLALFGIEWIENEG